MNDDLSTSVPVLTLATEETSVPQTISGEAMSAERLAELRGVLAVMADQPIATLEIHQAPKGISRTQGIALSAASPLAQQLSQLVTRSAKSSTAVASSTASGEVLYRMVVPAS